MYSGDSKTKILYLLSDVVTLMFSFFLLSQIHQYDFFSSRFFLASFLLLILFVTILTDEYSDITTRGYLKEIKASLIYSSKILVIFSFVLLLGKFRFLTDIAHISYAFLIKAFVLSSILIYLGRISVKKILGKRELEPQKALLVTNFGNERRLEKLLTERNYEIVEYVCKEKYYNLSLPVISGLNELRQFIANNQVDEIFVDSEAAVSYIESMDYLKVLGIPISIDISKSSDYYIGKSVIKNIEDFTFVTSAITIVKFRQMVLKRLLDIAIALIGLVLMGIVAIIIAPIVKKQSPGPLIFKQKRVGKNGRVFDIYKFRSMYLDAEERKKEFMKHNDLDTTLMFKMENDPRIFPFGQKMRDWSIDELPQFINVLKGDMSVVGTRPPTLEEYKQYEIHHFKRMATKPGITGLWQVSGRSDITDFEEVVALDLKYIQNWSIGEDIKIIARTFAVVLKREGSK